VLKSNDLRNIRHKGKYFSLKRLRGSSDAALDWNGVSIAVLTKATEVDPMSEKFEPAPIDKLAGKQTRSKPASDELEKGLKESFPASDPVSSTEPKKTTQDND
jgi:hypothetical protein